MYDNCVRPLSLLHNIDLIIPIRLNSFALEDNYYRPQRSCGQGYVFTRVCDSINRGGGGLPQCMLGYPSGSRQPPPPRADTPPVAADWHMVNEWPVRILLECILVTGHNEVG